MISREEIEHISRLARIALGETERKKFQKDLSSILAFVETLRSVETAAIEPLAGGTDLECVMRGDAEENGNATLEGYAEELVRAAPEHRGNRIKVKAVFDHAS